MELRFRTLTPLHIGDGSSLHSFDYAVEKGRFYRTSRRFFENFLDNLGGDAPERFASWSGDIVEQMEQCEKDRRRDPRNRDYNQKMSDLRKNHSLREFAISMKVESKFLDFLKQQKTPSLPIFSSDDRMQEIRGFQRDADERVFLPGSSVKGCIRTALLYNFLEKYADHEKVRQMLKEQLDGVKRDRDEAERRHSKFNVERHRKQFCEEIEHLAFRAGMIPERSNQAKYSEAQDDLLKCLLVSDVAVPPDAVGIEKIDLYLVKKLPKGAGYEAQRQRQAPAVEAIQPDQDLFVRLDFDIELLLVLHRLGESDEKGFKLGRETHFIGWREKAKIAFGLEAADFDAVPKNTKWNGPEIEKVKSKALAHVLDCCRKFSDAQAEALNTWQKEEFCNPKHNAGAMARHLEIGTGRVFSARGARLHLGFATGFEGMTVVLHLLAQHKKLFAEIMEMFGIGDSPSAWKNRRPGETYRANPDKFPKSHRLATRPGEILPLGWLEWADDPLAVAQPTHAAGSASISVPAAPSAPVFLKGSLKPGAELDAELVEGGNPGHFKLFIREDYQPTVALKYAAGFKNEDIGRYARVRVKNVKGKEEVTVVEFVRFW